ncbi:lipopolysaccharide assembly protein LapB [Sinobaca sp. H24]|uniref:tetratricopeptide repeat protein n=1 Tax=Sinobaca sp. H24 TaxID=2923376 RepID=UPI00207A19A8|nr:tetratricopeptide repeat protein [Sinobaca sp. H24]
MKSSTEKTGRVLPFLQNEEHYFKRGIHAFQKRELDRAVKYLKKAIDMDPTQGVFQCQLAVVYSDTGEYEESNRLLWHVLEDLDSSLSECYFFLANNYVYLGLFDKAKEMAESYLTMQPEGDFSKDARDLLDLLLEDEEEENNQQEEELIMKYEKSERLMKTKQFAEADQILEEIIADYPDYLPAKCQLARLLHEQDRSEEALALVKDIAREHMYLPALCQLAVLYAEMGRETEAQETAEMLKNIIPLDKSHLFYAASTLCRLGFYEESRLLFERYVKRHAPTQEGFHLFFGASAYQSGRIVQAEQQWKQSVNKDNHTAGELLKHLKKDGLSTEAVQSAVKEHYKL